MHNFVCTLCGGKLAPSAIDDKYAICPGEIPGITPDRFFKIKATLMEAQDIEGQPSFTVHEIEQIMDKVKEFSRKRRLKWTQ